jgi:DNA-binding LacI/PurR family transcriptional regulator
VKAVVTRVRLEDVAREAGVAKSTASRILNRTPGMTVRPETRERVLDVARDLRYEPHAAARGLRRAETGALGMLIPDLEVPVYAQMVRGAVRRGLERGFALLLAEDRDSGSPEEVYAGLVRTGRIDGLIVASARHRHPFHGLLGERGIPHVFLNRAVPGSGHNVTMDDAFIVASAVRHLVGLGHSRIGFLGGPRFDDLSTRRARGFRTAAEVCRLEKAVLVDKGDFRERSGVRQARALLIDHPDVTAIVTGGPPQAIGVYGAAWELGLSIPRELSVVSCDDMPPAGYLRPPLTCVKSPLDLLGAAAVDALLDQLGGDEPGDVVIETPGRLVSRGSTAPAR